MRVLHVVFRWYFVAERTTVIVYRQHCRCLAPDALRRFATDSEFYGPAILSTFVLEEPTERLYTYALGLLSTVSGSQFLMSSSSSGCNTEVVLSASSFSTRLLCRRRRSVSIAFRRVHSHYYCQSNIRSIDTAILRDAVSPQAIDAIDGFIDTQCAPICCGIVTCRCH
jgi:hypothetical protein